MTAFPQSNTSHIVKSEPSPIALAWWRNCLTIKQQIELIEKLHPNCHNGSGMLLCGLNITYSKNPVSL